MVHKKTKTIQFRQAERNGPLNMKNTLTVAPQNALTVAPLQH
jgi:hypothetical protein